MHRRDFLSSAGAAAALPLLPVPTALSGHYAKAASTVGQWAYVSVGNLKRHLGVDEATSRAVLARLQANGVIGAVGPHGVALGRSVSIMQSGIATRAVVRSGDGRRDVWHRLSAHLVDDDDKDDEDAPKNP